MNRSGLVGLTMVAIFDFQMSIYQLFEELQGSNSEFQLITPKPITGTYLETNLSRFGLLGLPIVAILYVGNIHFSAISQTTGLKLRI